MEVTKLVKLQHKFKVTLFINIILVTLLITVYYGLEYYQESLLVRQQNTLSAILFTKKKLADLKTQLNNIEQARRVWESIDHKSNMRQGLALDEAQEIINTAAEKYNITKLQVNLSPPVELGKEYKSLNTVIISSQVNLNFSALLDEQIFQFANYIIDHFPGFKYIKAFYVIKQASVNNNILQQIKTGNQPTLVKSELIFEWRDFKDLK